MALQDNYQDDGYNYDGYEEGYDEGAYEQSMQTVAHDGNKGKAGLNYSVMEQNVKALLQEKLLSKSAMLSKPILKR